MLFCFGIFIPIKLFNNSYPKNPINRSVLLFFFLELYFRFKKLLIFWLFKIIFFEKSVKRSKPLFVL